MIEQGKGKEFVAALKATLLDRATSRSRNEREASPEIVAKRRSQLEDAFAMMDALRFDRGMSDQKFWKTACTKPFYAGHKASAVEARHDYMVDEYLGNRQELNSAAWNPGRDRFEAFLDDEDCFRHPDNLTTVIAAANSVTASMRNHPDTTIIEHICRGIDDTNDIESLKVIHGRLNGLLKFGEVTTFHLMTELGFHVVKPDRVVNRIAIQMGLIDRYKKGSRTYILNNPVSVTRATNLGAIPEFNWALQAACRRIADEAGISMRLLDFMIVKLGQEPDDLNGFVRTICTETFPTCQLCEVKPMCTHSRK
jgi:hypothetical protein